MKSQMTLSEYTVLSSLKGPTRCFPLMCEQSICSFDCNTNHIKTSLYWVVAYRVASRRVCLFYLPDKKKVIQIRFPVILKLTDYPSPGESKIILPILFVSWNSQHTYHSGGEFNLVVLISFCHRKNLEPVTAVIWGPRALSSGRSPQDRSLTCCHLSATITRNNRYQRWPMKRLTSKLVSAGAPL